MQTSATAQDEILHSWESRMQPQSQAEASIGCYETGSSWLWRKTYNYGTCFPYMGSKFQSMPWLAGTPTQAWQ